MTGSKRARGPPRRRSSSVPRPCRPAPACAAAGGTRTPSSPRGRARDGRSKQPWRPRRRPPWPRPRRRPYDIDVGENASFAIEGTVEPAYVDSTDNSGQSTAQLEDNDSTLQIEGEHRFDGNTRAFFHLEYQYDSNETSGGINSTDSAWVGLAGDFGMVRTGTYDTLLENNMHELIDPFEYASVSEEADGGEGDQITYMSPGFGSGFSFGVELRVKGDGEGEIGESIAGGSGRFRQRPVARGAL
ncbi:MAG: porin [Halofilum sp. (in: g-proteobacteria)]|nr:porin [Halofilum sp. (in: g-proteobacteria)]